MWFKNTKIQTSKGEIQLSFVSTLITERGLNGKTILNMNGFKIEKGQKLQLEKGTFNIRPILTKDVVVSPIIPNSKEIDSINYVQISSSLKTFEQEAIDLISKKEKPDELNELFINNGYEKV